MSKTRREYDVYLESELSLGIACGELMVPPHAEVFKVREVIEGDTESDDEIERLREENKCFEAMQEGVFIRIADLDAEIKQLRERSWEISEDKRNIDMRRIEAEDALLYERHRVQQLRELLKGVVDDMVFGDDWGHLLSQIRKEVGDE